MANINCFRLCGGTFFVLIIQARKPQLSRSENYNRKSSGLSDPETLYRLASIVSPDFQKPELKQQSAKDASGDYKSCINQGHYYLLDEKPNIKAFNEALKKGYQACLKEMEFFVEDFIEIGTRAKKEYGLVQDCLALLEADETIKDSQLFFINQDGTSETKRSILDKTNITIYLPAFLLGFWHYVVNVDNKIGRKTYEQWCPPNCGSTRECVFHIGDGWKQKITFTERPKEAVLKEIKEATEEEEDEDFECLNCEVVEDKQSKTEAVPPTINFNINGGTNSFYNNVGTVINGEVHYEK